MNLAAPPTGAHRSGLSAAAVRRGHSFVISVAAAFLLNALAIGAFAAAATRWHAPAGGIAQTSWITAVAIAPPASPPEKPSAPTTAAPDGTTPVAPEPPAPVAPKAVLAPPTPSASADAGSLMRFYRSGEVDRPAEPDSDWNLDPAALDTAGIERLVFDIFIDRDGEVVGCTIVEPAELDPGARQLLEARLRETALRPAVRGGSTVASVRRIEISVLPGAP